MKHLRKFTAILLVVLMLSVIPASVLAAEEAKVDDMAHKVNIDAITEKFPQAAALLTSLQTNENISSANNTLAMRGMKGEEIAPIASYNTEDESGSYNLDVYSDGSYGYYGLLFDEVIVTPPEGTVNPRGTGLYGIGSEPVEGAGYTTYEGLRAFWSAGSTPQIYLMCMSFKFDYRMKKNNGNYTGNFLRAYDQEYYVGFDYSAKCYSIGPWSFVWNGVNITQICRIYDPDLNPFTDIYLFAGLINTSYLPQITSGQ